MYHPRNRNGFTLVELLVALMVTSIILTAVATLAYSLGKVNSSSGDSARIQAQVRFATLRLSDLIRHSRLVCGVAGGDLAIWRADDDGNNQINIEELVYIEKGPGSNSIRLCKFSSAANPTIELSDIAALSTDWWLGHDAEAEYSAMIPQCGNVVFSVDTAPPNSRFVTISFDVIENEATRHYQINAGLRGWAGHLLNEDGTAIVGDDD